MEIEEFESLMMTVLLSGFCLFMLFIMWDLARKSNAGRLGTCVIIGGLGLGMLAFVVKGVVIELILGV
ncbi:DUF2788 domain-containing protein [Marinomonas ostreistagni]|uniref:DUF2788 domain-containing protein n=1 Tax=Marinomonas ostreistagni TaxID=359209 RepID=UPI0019526FA7|nr:DUF2788 domain-containing protein [Marinomonas ostreistagni]MBM6549709.1 DUF2788 domain-containing protein [Marinomonas ostreistagni]